MNYFDVTLEPRNLTLRVPRGTDLQHLLFEHGAEFPCGGRGTCGRCRVKVLKGSLPIKDAEKEIPQEELDAGIRLACLHTVEEDLTFELEQWGHLILGDTTDFEFTPIEGMGIAFDLGSTTIAGQLVDCETGQVISVESGRNQQSLHGADIMSRISYAVEGGQEELCQIVREQIGDLAAKLFKKNTSDKELTKVLIVGNTPMHNLFCNISVEPLSRYPFTPDFAGFFQTTAGTLGWEGLPAETPVGFLPALGSFVGSDILAGVLATGLDKKKGLNVFVDLGTNGEIVVSNGERILCASTAAGPAFEAATGTCMAKDSRKAPEIPSPRRAAFTLISQIEISRGTSVRKPKSRTCFSSSPCLRTSSRIASVSVSRPASRKTTFRPERMSWAAASRKTSCPFQSP